MGKPTTGEQTNTTRLAIDWRCAITQPILVRTVTRATALTTFFTIRLSSSAFWPPSSTVFTVGCVGYQKAKKQKQCGEKAVSGPKLFDEKSTHGSLKSTACSCVSITLPATS